MAISYICLRYPAKKIETISRQCYCEQYLDVLTVHTHSQNIPLVDIGFFSYVKDSRIMS